MHSRSMQSKRANESRRLIAEIESYLRVVDAFRRAGCEPRWRSERLPARKLPSKEATC
jgi:hypothetical protein